MNRRTRTAAFTLGGAAALWAGTGTALAQDPPLPPGLAGGETAEQQADEPSAVRLGWSGFIETRLGTRLRQDPHERRTTLAELRFQPAVDARWGPLTGRVAAALLYDAVEQDRRVDLGTGTGPLDLREAHLFARPAGLLDLKLGRQVLTWGTGDLLFINDLFPKDWRSFLTGRDLEYLKAPSDALRVSAFTRHANLDVVYMPRFDADRYIDGSRLSFFNPQLGRVSGRDAVVRADRPDTWFEDDELAARLFRNAAGWELSAYAYRGFWKSPAGFDPQSGRATFPRLAVYGASARGMLGRAIVHAEAGLYDSRDDPDGTDPLVRNSELRLLLGAETELLTELTAGAQLYLERRLDHDAHLHSLPAGQPAGSRDRHVLTLRLTYQMLQQDLLLSWFSFYSPSDHDAFLLPRLSYRVSDRWSVDGGAGLFLGRDPHTFFGQFERNSSVFVGGRYGM